MTTTPIKKFLPSRKRKIDSVAATTEDELLSKRMKLDITSPFRKRKLNDDNENQTLEEEPTKRPKLF